MGRLVGVDLARALAVFGMFVVHIGPSASAVDGVGAWVRGLAEGRSSALFATLAGFSLMLIAGRLEPKTGLAGRQAKARIAIRAVILLALGTVMAMAYGGVVILAFYGLYFLLALPLVRLPARTLAIIAATIAVVMPPLAFGVRSLLTEPVTAALKAYDPLDRIGGVGILDLLVTGFYPAITWMAFVIAGMALGRLDLTDGTVRRRLAALGPALAVFAYGTSWLLGRLFDGVREAADADGLGIGIEVVRFRYRHGAARCHRVGLVAADGRAAQRNDVRHHRLRGRRDHRDRGRDGGPRPPAVAAPPGRTDHRRGHHVPDGLRRPLRGVVAGVGAHRARVPGFLGAPAPVHPRGDRVRRDLVPVLPPWTAGVPAQRRHQAGEAPPMRSGRVTGHDRSPGWIIRPVHRYRAPPPVIEDRGLIHYDR